MIMFSINCICASNLTKVSITVLFLDKDWEDIRKMPEHGTLTKDFKRSK